MRPQMNYLLLMELGQCKMTDFREAMLYMYISNQPNHARNVLTKDYKKNANTESSRKRKQKTEASRWKGGLHIIWLYDWLVVDPDRQANSEANNVPGEGGGGGGGGGHLTESRPCLRHESLVFLPCLRQNAEFDTPSKTFVVA